MTISQVIQTISLGNFTYFTVLHAYFSQISPHSCDNAAVVRHQCHVGLGVGLAWGALAWGALDWIELAWVALVMGRIGLDCIVLNHLVPRKRFKRYKVLFLGPIVPSESF